MGVLLNLEPDEHEGIRRLVWPRTDLRAAAPDTGVWAGLCESVMKSSMRQWRRLVLVAMLAWVLLFLGLLSYFLDARVGEPLTSAGSLLSQHPDIRRLASIQAAITGFRPEHVTVTAPSRPGADSSSPTPESSVREHTALTVPPMEARSSVNRIILIPKVWLHGPLLAQRMLMVLERTVETGPLNRTWTIRTILQRNGGVLLLQILFSGTAFVEGNVSSGMLSPRLQRAMKDYMSANKHNVEYKGQRKHTQSANNLLCQIKAQAKLTTVDGSEEPFSSLGWEHLVPSLPLEQLYRRGGQGPFKTCAVVTSAGAILRSGLGREIDTHDAVLRFNAAPTDGYERDVGNRTTIRIINSQILANPRHRFNTSSIYKNVTLVAWDPAPYTVNLQKWYANPDYNLFGPYMEHRNLHPDQPFYILHPNYVWRLWDVIQSNTKENIQPNPPSSGFIGILLMMALCEKVHVYEYIPSMRQTDLCHYHERYFDAACTLGAYHPLLYEKSLIQRLNTGPEIDLRRRGRVTLPGLSTIDCDV
ncbi:hypothetical protein WMY93_028615 [Mugilogobius chulae]|uniref:Beta-galactoside alpha-2,6-sialyltransferase 2 n=1 Tax=Mugilogobius chulae TaxID=88201 RepID=A0AAW0MTB7_9GOBI